MSSPLDDLFGNLFGKRDPVKEATESLKVASEKAARDRKNEPAPQVRCREIDGVVYVRAEDVVAALRHAGQGSHPFARKLQGRIDR